MFDTILCTLGCSEGDVRLSNGRTSLEGRVEICTNDTWGTVCDIGWQYRDAQVVCRQLGFSAAGISLRCAFVLSQ